MSRPMRKSLTVALAALMAGATLAGSATGQPALAGGGVAAAPAAAPGQVIRVELAAGTTTTRSLALGRGKSALIELPVDARDVTITSPTVADLVMRTPRRISVLGLAPGQTDAVFFDGMGRPILSLDIRVDQDSLAVSQTLSRILPGSRIHVEAVNNSLILSGRVANAAEADRAQQIAAQFVDKPERVLNMLTVEGKDQVMLKVRVVEVQRSSIKQLGFNMNAVLGQVGGNQWGASFSPSWGVNGALLGGASGGFSRDTTTLPIDAAPDGCQKSNVIGVGNIANCVGTDRVGSDGLNKANAMMQAFERAGLIRTLAEPNLTAVSGEAAKFLVGGEFPVPTGQDDSGRVSIEFKPFGVGLGFTPVVLSDGRISIKLSTEVSELSNEGAFSLANGNGAPVLVIPSLKVRRAETAVELPSGGALMIAGLLQDQTRQNIDSLPGLINLPILGSLFRSRDFLRGETELVVIVTPYLVNPTRPGDLQTPADGLQLANDAQTILLGQLNKTYKAPPQATAGRTYQGPYGYVIE